MNTTYHRLTREVVNPKPDGRSRAWTCQPTWPTGMLVVVRRGEVDAKFMSNRASFISRPGKHGRAYGYSPRGEALLEAIGPEVETLATALEPLCSGNNDMVLAWLLEATRPDFDLADVHDAVEMLNEMDSDEWNALRERHLL